MRRRSWPACVIGLAFAVFAAIAGSAAGSEWVVDVESGVAASGYNVARIPGDGGTQLSLSHQFDLQPEPFIRVRIFYQLTDSHGLGVLYAPLTLEGQGRVDFPVQFADVTFPGGSDLEALYRFNSYRLTYRYRLLDSASLQADVGVTGKIRDAEIRLEGSGLAASKTDVGFVPLLYLRADWRFAPAWSLLLEADALAAPQGRAEDALLAFTWSLDPHWRIKAGYRILEGGADNAEVYNFSLIHYGVVGIVAQY